MEKLGIELALIPHVQIIHYRTAMAIAAPPTSHCAGPVIMGAAAVLTLEVLDELPPCAPAVVCVPALVAPGWLPVVCAGVDAVVLAAPVLLAAGLEAAAPCRMVTA